MRWVFASVLAAFSLAGAAPVALASEQHPTPAEIENEIWCNDCKKTLAEANNLTARDIRIYLHVLIAAGDSKSEVKRKIVSHYWWHVKALPSRSVERASLADLEGEVMCPVCNTTLDQSSSPAARQIEGFISRRIAAGDTKDQIKDKLVADYGPQILAAPPRHGFDLLAWVLPLVGILGATGAMALLAWRWTRRREEPEHIPGPWSVNGRPLDPELERRLDEELARFDG